MERGQEGRPAHGTDESVEAIELDGAQADEDAHDELIERGASTEGPSPEHVPGAGPPAHWLAYIRARAPWLLSAGGVLGEAAKSSSPDVVPHGPAAHIAPWPPVEPASSAVRATAPVVPAFGDVPARRPGRETAPRNDEPGERRRDDGRAPLPRMPEVAPESHASRDRPPATDDPGGRREELDATLRAAEQETAEATPSVAALGPEAAPESPTHAIPSPDPVSPPPPPLAWPALPPSENGTSRGRSSEPWSPPIARAPQDLSPMSEPHSASRERARAAFEPLPAPTRRDATPDDLGGWRVRAAAPDTSTVARLALPPWPDLPEPPPDDDDPDWRAIERRLQRAARLDREQRRR